LDAAGRSSLRVTLGKQEQFSLSLPPSIKMNRAIQNTGQYSRAPDGGEKAAPVFNGMSDPSSLHATDASSTLSYSRPHTRRLFPKAKSTLETANIHLARYPLPETALLPIQMDSSSQSSNLSPVPSRSSEGRQPTYTTVGSIYDPKQAAPLQPPARRPRRGRLPPLVLSPPRDPLRALPDALLSALSIKDRLRNSPPPATRYLPEYSPLQQNYDRAVSPSNEDKHAAGGRSMLAPTIRSGNIPPPPGFRSTSADRENKATRAFDDSDSIASEGTLASSRITVKGLTSLASYPNPMQKAAQNKLARARAANLANSRAGTPSISVASDLGRDRVTSGGSTVIGTPQPLTAGPPGQRQFRPSTIEGVTRALGTGQDNLDATLRAELEWPGLGSTAVDLSRASDEQSEQLVPLAFDKTADATDPFLLGQRPPYFGNRVSVPNVSVGWTVHDGSNRSTTMTPFVGEDTEETERRHPDDTIPRDLARLYYPHGFPASYTGRYNAIAETRCDEYPQQGDPSASWSHETVSEQQAKLNQRFYAGVEAFIRDIHSVAHEHDNRSFKNKIGVIGEGRQQASTSHCDKIDSNGRPQLAALEVEEANRIPSHAHSEPLLSMAFATLLRCKEEISNRQSAEGVESNGILKPDQTWIDDSSEGNKSFYEPQNAGEQLRKRRTIKRARRGY